MNRKLFLKIFSGIILLAFLGLFLIKVVVEPWIGAKIRTALNETNKDFTVKIDKINFLVSSSGLELENVVISSKTEQKGLPVFKGEIVSVKLKGIKLLKVLFKKDIDIREVIISDVNVKGKLSFQEKAGKPKISPANIRIDSLIFDKMHLEISNTSDAQAYSVKDGILRIYDCQVSKLDTLTLGIVTDFDFDALEFHAVSADSMYSNTAIGINYSTSSKKLVVDSFSVHPNYPDYEFTARHPFETDRFEAGFKNISVHDFDAAGYFSRGSLISSYIEIGKLDLKAFRDKREEFRHVNKPAFQDMIYNYPGALQIDSLGILSGNIIYTEHAEKANEAGWISFHKVHVKAFRITNDPIYKTENADLQLKCNALLMGKGKLAFLLNGRIFDKHNTFRVNGTLSEMEIRELNPMLEKNAFLYATSGRIDAMNFRFTANNSKASGKLEMLYHGLNIAVKNKRTDDTTAIKERIISVIANMKVLNSNPIPGDEVRVGIIDWERDPEKFLFNYCFKSVLSGIKTSVTKSPKKGKK